MIEILFEESETASMKIAKNTVLYGKTDEVINLGLLLDIGDITEDIDSEYRKNLIYHFYMQNRQLENDAFSCELKQRILSRVENFQKLRQYIFAGEDIRIWYSNSPYSLCGFYHLCSILQNCKNKIHIVKLPEYKKEGKIITSYKNWGEVCPEEFANFITKETQLSMHEIRMYASKWNELKEDGSQLRAMVNGEVVGVPEEFYDFLIWKRIGTQPIKQARLIGDILGYYSVGISDIWYAKRIEYFIQQKKIEIVEDSANKYARLLRKSRAFI